MMAAGTRLAGLKMCPTLAENLIRLFLEPLMVPEIRYQDFDLQKLDHEYSYLGLFGYLKNATVKNLYLEAEEVSGDDNIAILAGCVEGKSAIHNVTVNGFVYAKSGDAGAIAGEMTGGTQYAVVENCIADDVSINSQGTGSFVGGIVGNAQKADIVDVQVITQDGDSNRIQGKGYVGGVAGRQNKVNIIIRMFQVR